MKIKIINLIESFKCFKTFITTFYFKIKTYIKIFLLFIVNLMRPCKQTLYYFNNEVAVLRSSPVD